MPPTFEATFLPKSVLATVPAAAPAIAPALFATSPIDLTVNPAATVSARIDAYLNPNIFLTIPSAVHINFIQTIASIIFANDAFVPNVFITVEINTKYIIQ